MKVENETARQFYLDECIKSGWSTRQLEGQINSFFHERLLSSNDKVGVETEINKFAESLKMRPRDKLRGLIFNAC